jgi:hypothetical protein
MRQLKNLYTQTEDKQCNNNDSINLLTYMTAVVQAIADSTAKIKIKILNKHVST